MGKKSNKKNKRLTWYRSNELVMATISPLHNWQRPALRRCPLTPYFSKLLLIDCRAISSYISIACLYLTKTKKNSFYSTNICFNILSHLLLSFHMKTKDLYKSWEVCEENLMAPWLEKLHSVWDTTPIKYMTKCAMNWDENFSIKRKSKRFPNAGSTIYFDQNHYCCHKYLQY